MGTLVCRPGKPAAQARCPRKQSEDTLMPHAVRTRPPHADDDRVSRAPSHRSGVRAWVLSVVAVLVFVAALLGLGLDGLIPFGLLVAFGLGSGDVDSRRVVVLSRRNLA